MGQDDDEDKMAAAEEDEEEDLEKLQAEIDRMEAEAAKIAKQTEELEKKKLEKTGDAAAAISEEEQAAKDSVYVGQVDYAATPEDLVGHFQSCGTVERVTIVCDKYTGQPKGFAYIEFNNEAAVANAVKLDGSELKGRTLKVTPKRVNIPGFNRGGGRGRGRGGGGRGDSFRGGYNSGGRGGFVRGSPGRAGYRGGFRGRGGGGRGRAGRRGGGFQPY